MRVRDMPTANLQLEHKTFFTAAQGIFLKRQSRQFDVSISCLIRELVETRMMRHQGNFYKKYKPRHN